MGSAFAFEAGCTCSAKQRSRFVRRALPSGLHSGASKPSARHSAASLVALETRSPPLAAPSMTLVDCAIEATQPPRKSARPASVCSMGRGRSGHFGTREGGRHRDNVTPNHIPSHAYGEATVDGYSRWDGVALNMEMPFPGTGGRHRATVSYGPPPDLSLTPDSLSRGTFSTSGGYMPRPACTVPKSDPHSKR